MAFDYQQCKMDGMRAVTPIGEGKIISAYNEPGVGELFWVRVNELNHVTYRAAQLKNIPQPPPERLYLCVDMNSVNAVAGRLHNTTAAFVHEAAIGPIGRGMDRHVIFPGCMHPVELVEKFQITVEQDIDGKHHIYRKGHGWLNTSDAFASGMSAIRRFPGFLAALRHATEIAKKL